ncbi:MAG: hypothetical protein QXV69_04360 [Sulfolobaceae archaeon]
MHKVLILTLLILLLASSPISSIFLVELPKPTAEKIPSIIYYDYLKYKIDIIKTYKNHSTKNSYYIEYKVINSIDLNLTVNISGNYTEFKNITIINNGTYSLNIITNLFTFKYPYILPYLIFNNTYAIYYKNSYIIVSFQNYTKYLNNTIYILRIITQNGSSYNVSVLENGIISEINFKKDISNYTYNIDIKLLNLSNPKTIGLPITFNSNLLQYSYLYTVYNYSSIASNILPQGYIEFVYPYILPGNYIVSAQFRLQYIAGNRLLTPISIQGTQVNFIISIGKPNEIFIPIILNLNNTISWYGYLLKKINQTQVNVLANTYNAYLYLNSTNFTITSGNSTIFGKRLVYAYFNSNGTLLKFRIVAFSTNITATALELDFIGSKYNDYYLNPTLIFPNVASYSNTNLPFNVISPNISLVITIIVTLIIVIIAVILRRKTY